MKLVHMSAEQEKKFLEFVDAIFDKFKNFRSETYHFFAKTYRPLWYGYAMWVSSIFIRIVTDGLGHITLLMGVLLIIINLLMRNIEQHREMLNWRLRFFYVKHPLEHLGLDLFDFEKLEAHDIFTKKKDESEEAKMGFCKTDNVVKAKLGLDLMTRIINIDTKTVGPDFGSEILKQFINVGKNHGLIDKEATDITSEDLDKTFGKIFKK